MFMVLAKCSYLKVKQKITVEDKFMVYILFPKLKSSRIIMFHIKFGLFSILLTILVKYFR